MKIVPEISVIISTHNPQKNHINRVVDALKSQTFPLDLWELLLIDNASDEPLDAQIDLNWHPSSRYIREDELGVARARLRGMKETESQLLVFLDDDNVVDRNYLETASQIERSWPMLGAWGGQIIAEFEEPPPEWTKMYWGMLAIRELEQDKWSNLLHQHETTPCGAGMCVRRVVADRYVREVSNNPKRLNLDRKGTSLISNGDADLAFTSCEMGLGTGLFVALKLTHLLPKDRLEEEYLLKMREAMSYSDVILDSIRGRVSEKPRLLGQSRLFQYYMQWRSDPRTKRFYMASKRGYDRAMQEIATFSPVSDTRTN